MKELEKYEKVNQEVVIPIKSEMTLIGTLKPQKGHKCFEINVVTNEVIEATYIEEEITIFSSTMYAPKRKLKVKQDCVYITALNKQNALKKYNKSNK